VGATGHGTAGSDAIDGDGVLELLRSQEALLEGHFLLSSGLHSDRYFQCALALAHPPTAERLARGLAAALGELPVDLVVGPAMGAVVWAQEVARALGTRAFFTERNEGRMALRRGFRVKPGERVLVVEDVVTTGGSAREVIELLTALGARPVAVGCIVDRSGAADPFKDLGLELVALARVDVRTWRPDEAPAEFRGSTAVKPGSRPAGG
jgi:orotate phosphoribosyltransferase